MEGSQQQQVIDKLKKISQFDINDNKILKHGYQITLDSSTQTYYTNEPLTVGIKNHVEIKYDYSSVGIGGDFQLPDGDYPPPVGGTTADVKLTVIRGPRFTHGGRPAAYGKLYVNGQYWFDTGERSMVTPGTYPVAFRKETGCSMTGRKDWLEKGRAGDPMRRFAVYSHGYVPLVMNTAGRSGIRIHQGTSVAWSEGCLITGNLNNGRLENSWECWKRLYDFCYNAKSVTITYQG